VNVSLWDVAAKAGVSATTVSRVLNAKKDTRVADATRQRVLTVASEMNYSPSRAARTLRSRSTMNIGVVVSCQRNPFFAELLDSLERLVVDAEYDVLTDTGHRVQGQGLRGWPVDGIIMWASPLYSIEDYLGQSVVGVPTVYLGERRPDNSDYVAHDAHQGATLALGHLWEKGHRKIAFVVPESAPYLVTDERRVAYLDFCFAKRIEPMFINVAGGNLVGKVDHSAYRHGGYAVGVSLAEASADERPTAVLCYNDLIAIGLINGSLTKNLRVPEDIAVVGFDGIDEGRYHLKTLTSVVSPYVRSCEAALSILLDRIAGSGSVVPRQIVHPMSLRVGASS